MRYDLYQHWERVDLEDDTYTELPLLGVVREPHGDPATRIVPPAHHATM